MAKRILIIDDDQAVRDALRLSLTPLSCEVVTEADGAKGLMTALGGNFDLVVVDIALPGMNGLDICRKLRQEQLIVPILMLTSRGSEVDIVVGLEQGADDYVVKPFRVTELVARIRALLRRAELRSAPAALAGVLEFGPLKIDPESRVVSVSSKPVELTALEFDVVYYLAERQGRTISREQLTEAVWGDVLDDRDGSINTVLSRLRKKLEIPNADFIVTIRGVGYRFDAAALTGDATSES